MAKSNSKNGSMIPTLAIIATLTVFFLIFGNKGPGGAARPATSATVSTATDRSATAAGTRAAPPASNGSDIGQPIDSVRVDRARVALSMLPVKGRAAKTGYNRDRFGQPWSDDVDVPGGRNGCDTRNDILKRDLIAPTFKPGTRDCVVLTGTLDDPYNGKRSEYARGSDSARIQIDHVVPLSLAWQFGAQHWDARTRQNFANDPANLLAVDGPTNGKKGDASPASWMPPNRGFWCAYAVSFIEVAAGYGMATGPADKVMLQRGLDACPI